MKCAVASCGFCLLCLVYLCGLLFGQGYRLNRTSSMPMGIYRLAEGQRIEQGDRVSVCLSGSFAALALERGYLRPGSCPGGSEPLLKIVAGLAGDMVDLTPDGIRINGQLQPCSKPKAFDSQHRPMPVDLVPGRIPDGLALVLSHMHPGGFDGRYFGLVPLAALHKVNAVSVFTAAKGEGS